MTDTRTNILHAILLLAVIAAALVLALTGRIDGGLAVGVIVAAAGIAAPSPFTTSSTPPADTTPGLSAGA